MRGPAASARVGYPNAGEINGLDENR